MKFILTLSLAVIIGFSSCNNAKTDLEESDSKAVEDTVIEKVEKVVAKPEEKVAPPRLSKEEELAKARQYYDSIQVNSIFEEIPNRVAHVNIINSRIDNILGIYSLEMLNDHQTVLRMLDSKNEYKEFFQDLENAKNGVIKNSQYLKRYSLSDDFVQKYYAEELKDTIKVFVEGSNVFKGALTSDHIEYIDRSYENAAGYSSSGIAYHLPQKEPNFAHYYGVVGDWFNNSEISTNQLQLSYKNIDILLGKNGFYTRDEKDSYFIQSWYIEGYDKIFTTGYRNINDYDIEGFLIETSMDTTITVMSLDNNYEIRELSATSIFVNGKPILSFLLSDSGLDGGFRQFYYFDGSKYTSF